MQNQYGHLLHKGETVLWEGQPERGFLMPRRTLYILLFTLLMLALVFAPWDGRSWESFFIAMGALGTFIIAMYAVMVVRTHGHASQEYYLLTDRRVMILVEESTGLRLQDVRLLRKAPPVRTQREGRGCATIYIGPQVRYEHFALFFVPDGEAVADLIRSRIGSLQEHLA